MPNAATTLPVQRRARTRRETTAGRVRELPPPPVLEKQEVEEDTRGWIEAHLERIVAFIGSAAIAAALVSRVLPAPVHAAPVRPTVQIPSAIVAAPAVETEVAAPVPTPAAPPSPVVAPDEAAAPEIAARIAVAPAAPTKHQVHVANVVPASKRHAKARSYRTLAHAAGARAAVPADGNAAPAAARNAYLRGDVDSAEQLLRKAGHIGQADRVASVTRYLSEAQGKLREHDEAPATRAFDAAARADRELAFGSGRISRDVGRELGNLRLAAGLRARRAGNEAGARREFEAAHRADPSNSRASVELQSFQDEVQVQDAIDPD
jgi:hypothetical protein